MKLGLNVVAVLLFLMGAVWFFQGIGVIKGSFMTGTAQWTLIGAALMIGSVGLLIYAGRR